MGVCQFCHTDLLENARFCHHCGAKVKAASITCPQCASGNPATAQFCVNCGYNFVKASMGKTISDYDPQYPLNFRKLKGVSSEIRQYFIQALDKRLQERHNAAKKEAYFNRLMQSDFQKIFQLRSEQLAEEAYSIHTRQHPRFQQEIDDLLREAFNGLLDFFIIRHCRDLNDFDLPESILKYEGIPSDEIDRFQLLWDFLAPEQEEDLQIYFDFLKMPLQKLQNAGRYFLFPAKDEKILLICDQTIFGSCKEGFAFTDLAIYWKSHFKKAQKVFYKNLDSMEQFKDHLLLNGHFFNVNPAMNRKVLYFLSKMKRIA